MTAEQTMFFNRHPEALPLYEALDAAILSVGPDITVKVQSSQITYYCGSSYAAVWLPGSRMRGQPKGSLALTFYLPYRLNSPRIYAFVEPYPGRFTHHAAVTSVADIDAELMSWLGCSRAFALSRRGRGKQ